MRSGEPPLVVHVIHHLVIGGMENGLVNLINHLSPTRYRHAIVCVDDFSDFRNRIRREGVEVYAMRKGNLTHAQLYSRLFALLRSLRPAIVHTRNLSGLDGLLPAFLAGIPIRIHGEHGWSTQDLGGENPKLCRLRKLHRPLVTRYVCVSDHLRQYLVQKIGVPDRLITRIYNGVDTGRFHPADDRSRTVVGGAPWGDEPRFVIGTVGRLQPVKNQVALLQAVRTLFRRDPGYQRKVGVAIVGDGPEREALRTFVASEGLAESVWFTGARDDVADVLPNFDVFVLPSLAEGISNTILEAMACGLPVIATAVGGNVELVVDGVTGQLVPSGDIPLLVGAVEAMVAQPSAAKTLGANGRARALSQFSLASMVRSYDNLYQNVLNRRRPSSAIASKVTDGQH